MILALSDQGSALETGIKITFRTPFPMTLYACPRASLNTASTSGNVVVDILQDDVSILGTDKITIDGNTKTSVVSNTPSCVVTELLTDDSEIKMNVISSGTNANGLKVTLYYRKN
jgi:hypothetical protein